VTIVVQFIEGLVADMRSARALFGRVHARWHTAPLRGDLGLGRRYGSRDRGRASVYSVDEMGYDSSC
jgi:hypothetical protein